MKQQNQQYSRGVLFLSALLVGMSVQAAGTAPDSPAAIQRDRALVQPYRQANVLWARGGKQSGSHGITQLRARSLQQNGGAGMAATVTGSGVIALPGSAGNNTRLKNAMNSARSHFTSMKTARSQSSYDMHQNTATLALDTAVNSYLYGRKAAANRPSISGETENDPFLQTMATLKMDVLRKSLTAPELNDMLDRLASARAILVGITEATQ
jgi:hypothetical protein